MRKPWFREQNQTWYVHFNKKQVRLVSGKGNEQQAYDAWKELRDADTLLSPDVTIAAICESFLLWTEKNRAGRTLEYYGEYLADLSNTLGLMPARKLRQIHITQWIDARGWTSDARRRGAITSVKRALNWACEQDVLKVNPIGKMKRPEVGRRETVVAPDAHQAMIAKADRGYASQYRQGAFRAFLIALRHSGCRPKEIREVTAAQYEPRAAIWKFDKHKTSDRVQKPRIIHLSPCLNTLSRILSHFRPSGPMFLNSEGNPWTANAIRCRVRRLREDLDLPAGVVSYSYRHTFATEGLLNGVNIATMAELLGHQDTKMISQHYGHLDQHSEHLKAAVDRAIRPTLPPSQAEETAQPGRESQSGEGS